MAGRILLTSLVWMIVLADLSSQEQPSCPLSGQTLTSSSGDITDGAGNYKDSEFCSWIIMPCGASSVTLHFTEFMTEMNYDFLRLFSCSLPSCDSAFELPGSPFSGYNTPLDVTSCTGIMKVEFQSDQSSSAYSGFAARFTGYKPGANPSCPNFGSTSENSCLNSDPSTTIVIRPNQTRPVSSNLRNVSAAPSVVLFTSVPQFESKGQQLSSKLSNLTSVATVLTGYLGGIEVLVRVPSLGQDEIVSLTAILGIRAKDFSLALERSVKIALSTFVGDPKLITADQILISDVHEVSSSPTSIRTQLLIQMNPDPEQNYSVACPLTSDQRKDVKSSCGGQQSCNCLISTIEGEENPRLCAAYADPRSPFRNAVVNCIRRDCGEYQFLLVFFLLGCGGLLGGILLFCANGCTFRPADEDSVSEGRALEEQAQGAADDAAGGGDDDDDSEKFPSDVDLTDGVDDGEVGVVAQWALGRLYQSALAGSEEQARAARETVARRSAAASLLKKVALKLLLVVPLVLQENWVPAGAFAIDVAVLVYCGAAGVYCPGSLYNDVHVLVRGRRFVRRFPWRRFSLWMKFFVGFQVPPRRPGLRDRKPESRGRPDPLALSHRPGSGRRPRAAEAPAPRRATPRCWGRPPRSPPCPACRCGRPSAGGCWGRRRPATSRSRPPGC